MSYTLPQDTEIRRLESWKSIAEFFSRDVRTVKRWELTRGLPIHRLPGKRGGVFAYEHELSAWVNSGAAERLDESPDLDAAAEPELILVEEPLQAASEPLPHNSDTGHQSIWGFGEAHGAGLGILALAVVSVAIVLLLQHPRSAHSSAVSDLDRRRAHELYLEGRYSWNQRTPESLNRALDDFTQAIVHDPENAPAYAGMADTYDMLRVYSNMSATEASPRAIGAAKRAVQLDDSLPEAHRALALAYSWGNGNFIDAEREFRRAIALNPADPLAHKWFADALTLQHRNVESLEEIDKAQELDPGSNAILADKGAILYNSGRISEGVALLKQVEQSAPQLSSPHEYLMGVYEELEDWPEYLAEGTKKAETSNDPVLREIMAAARAGYLQDGARGMLRSQFAKKLQFCAAGKYSKINMASEYLRFKKRPEALGMLEAARQEHDPAASPAHLMIGAVKAWRDLRDEPRFKALLQTPNSAPITGRPSQGEPAPGLAVPALRAESSPH